MKYVQKMYTLLGHSEGQIKDMTNNQSDNSLPLRVFQQINLGPASSVWTPSDFYSLGSPDAINKALQRMVANKKLRRIDRGLYDQPHINPLTGKLTAPDYHKVIDAISRRDQIRVLIDGMSAANDLGLTNAVPAKVIVLTDARIRNIRLHNLVIQFKLTAPSKLYWAGHPAMRIVQALYWLRDGLKTGTLEDEPVITNKLIHLLKDRKVGNLIIDDLTEGLYTLPVWMGDWIKNLLAQVK